MGKFEQTSKVKRVGGVGGGGGGDGGRWGDMFLFLGLFIFFEKKPTIVQKWVKNTKREWWIWSGLDETMSFYWKNCVSILRDTRPIRWILFYATFLFSFFFLSLFLPKDILFFLQFKFKFQKSWPRWGNFNMWSKYPIPNSISTASLHVYRKFPPCNTVNTVFKYPQKLTILYSRHCQAPDPHTPATSCNHINNTPTHIHLLHLIDHYKDSIWISSIFPPTAPRIKHHSLRNISTPTVPHSTYRTWFYMWPTSNPFFMVFLSAKLTPGFILPSHRPKLPISVPHHQVPSSLHPSPFTSPG
jgi:hypothetical protein